MTLHHTGGGRGCHTAKTERFAAAREIRTGECSCDWNPWENKGDPSGLKAYENYVKVAVESQQGISIYPAGIKV